MQYSMICIDSQIPSQLQYIRLVNNIEDIHMLSYIFIYSIQNIILIIQ